MLLHMVVKHITLFSVTTPKALPNIKSNKHQQRLLSVLAKSHTSPNLCLYLFYILTIIKKHNFLTTFKHFTKGKNKTK